MVEKVMLLDAVRKLSQSELRIFLTHGYAVELLWYLRNKGNVGSLIEIYESLHSPKPRKQSFDAFISRLVTLGFLEASEGEDKRKKSIGLSKKTLSVLHELNMIH